MKNYTSSALTNGRKPWIQSGKSRVSPTFSNKEDCKRYSCPATPWHWATRWALEKAQLTDQQIVADLGAGTNPIALQAYHRQTKSTYLIDNLILPTQNLGHHLKRTLADISFLPLPDESVDVVISISVLEHFPVEKRLLAMKQIARILKPAGRAILTIGLPLKASSQAQYLMSTLSFFTERGCPLYFPINIKQMLEATPELQLAGTDRVQYLPGFTDYNEQLLLKESSLVLENWGDYPALAPYPSLTSVKHCEVGVLLLKQ